MGVDAQSGEAEAPVRIVWASLFSPKHHAAGCTRFSLVEPRPQPDSTVASICGTVADGPATAPMSSGGHGVVTVRGQREACL